MPHTGNQNILLLRKMENGQGGISFGTEILDIYACIVGCLFPIIRYHDILCIFFHEF